MFQWARIARKHAYTRFFLGCAVLLARPCEEQWSAAYGERVLDRDRFAFWLGQGKRLLKVFRDRLDRLNKEGLPDNEIPTLTERIDHLQSLTRREAQQVKNLQTVQLGQPPSAPPAGN